MLFANGMFSAVLFFLWGHFDTNLGECITSPCVKLSFLVSIGWGGFQASNYFISIFFGVPYKPTIHGLFSALVYALWTLVRLWVAWVRTRWGGGAEAVNEELEMATALMMPSNNQHRSARVSTDSANNP